MLLPAPAPTKLSGGGRRLRRLDRGQDVGALRGQGAAGGAAAAAGRRLHLVRLCAVQGADGDGDVFPHLPGEAC